MRSLAIWGQNGQVMVGSFRRHGGIRGRLCCRNVARGAAGDALLLARVVEDVDGERRDLDSEVLSPQTVPEGQCQ